MKKNLILVAAMAAFTACQIEDLNQTSSAAGEKFVITALIDTESQTQSNTRTTTDADFKVSWDDDDALSVIAKYTDGTQKAYRFAFVEGGENSFSCENVENPGDIQSLSVFYPYDEAMKEVDGTGFGNAAVSFGSASQAKTGSISHIDAPICGTGEVKDGTAEIIMRHASALMEILVKNTTNNEITVSDIALSYDAGTCLTGDFFVNPETGALKQASASTSAKISVSEGKVPAGQTGKFYVSVAPFTMTADSPLYVSVTAGGSETTTSKTVTDETSFKAGTVNHINVAVDQTAVSGTLYEKFDAGYTIDVNGLKVNKSLFDKYYHVTEDLTIERDPDKEYGPINGISTGVYFVDSGKTLTIKGHWRYNFQYLIVIGNDSNGEAYLNIVEDNDKSMIYLGGGKTVYNCAFHNMTINVGQSICLDASNSLFNLSYTNCDISINTQEKCLLSTYCNDGREGITANVMMKDCSMSFGVDGGSVIGSGGRVELIELAEFENNVFYSPADNQAHTFSLINAQTVPVKSLTVKNNTFYNLSTTKTWNAYINIAAVVSGQEYYNTRNIYYYAMDMPRNIPIFFPKNYEVGPETTPLYGSVKNNIGYVASGTAVWGDTWGGKTPVEDYVKMETMTGSENSPFATIDASKGIFIQKDEYADYGAKL